MNAYVYGFIEIISVFHLLILHVSRAAAVTVDCVVLGCWLHVVDRLKQKR